MHLNNLARKVGRKGGREGRTRRGRKKEKECKVVIPGKHLMCTVLDCIAKSVNCVYVCLAAFFKLVKSKENYITITKWKGMEMAESGTALSPHCGMCSHPLEWSSHCFPLPQPPHDPQPRDSAECSL